MRNRGMGYEEQPTYTENGVKKTANTWRICYSVNGRRIRESVNSTKKADADRLLKQRIAEAGSGKPVGPELDRTTFEDLNRILIDHYRPNERKSTKRREEAF